MIIRGQIKNGKVELDEPVDIPDGTLVEVRQLPNLDGGKKSGGHYPDISNFTIDDMVGIAKGVDASDDAIARYILEKHS